jgi:hypothetical protein
VMVSIAKTAVARIRVLSENARKLAKWIEKHPDKFYRHANCPYVADDAIDDGAVVWRSVLRMTQKTCRSSLGSRG